MSSFHIGQRIVCIARGWHSSQSGVPLPVQVLPKKGVIYHVRGIDPTHLQLEFIWLAEIYSPLIGGIEASFCATGFRPIIERATDISIFQKLLVPNRKELERS